ncbi:hypothetical protein PENSPDRAFT_738180, partial [Peniophora sp. CONT]
MSAQGDLARQAWIAHAQARLGPVDILAHDRSSSSSDRADAWEAAKAELNAAVATMTVIRISMNALQPACRVPHDVLVHIFLWARDLDPPSYRQKPTYGWMAITQVCAYWRKASLDCRSLWNRVVPCLGRAWAKNFAGRSHPSPLSIEHDSRMDALSGTGWENIRKSTKHLIETVPQRIEVLDIEAPWTVTVHPILSFIFTHASSLSSLRTLNLKTTDKHGAVWMEQSDSYLPLTSLTTLGLTDALLDVPWALLPSTITSITIYGTVYLPGNLRTRGMLRELYQLLRRSTLLETLSLSFGETSSWSDIDDKEGLELPNLRRLKLVGHAKGCISAIRALNSLHTLTGLTLDIKSATWEALSIASFTPIIQSVFKSLHCDPFTRLSITGKFSGDQKTYLALNAHRASEYDHGVISDSDSDGTTRTESPSLSIIFKTDDKTWKKTEYRDLMLELLSAVDLSRVESLLISVKGLAQIGWTAIDWLIHLRSAQAVRSIRIGKDCVGLFYALGSSTRIEPLADEHNHIISVEDTLEPVMDASDMLFPQLQSLVCDYIDFNEVVNHETGIRMHQVVTRALTGRLAFAGVPRKLILKQCWLQREQRARWRTAVPVGLRDWDYVALRDPNPKK